MSSEQQRGETERLDFSNKLNQLVAWVKTLPAIQELLDNPQENSGSSLILGIAEQMQNCFPTDGGDGNGTIPQEVDFWFDNQQLFADFLRDRVAAIELFEQWKQLQQKMASLKSKLVLHDSELLAFGLRPGNGFKRYQAERQELFKDIDTLEVQLQTIKPEFDRHQANFNNIISHIDCKLLTVVFGKILESLGWEVTMLCYKKPTHPYLKIVSPADIQRPTVLITDWFAFKDKYRSALHTTEYDRRYIIRAKEVALRLGFITEDDDWPLPFTKATFDRFDQWFLDHQA